LLFAAGYSGVRLPFSVKRGDPANFANHRKDGPNDMFGFKRARRTRIRKQPLPQSWRSILERRVAYFRLLSVEEQAQLVGHVGIFLAEKRFEGCGGLEITDEIRLTISAMACVLLLGRDTDYFPLMRTVLVYPHHFLADATHELEGGIVFEGRDDREGESWYRGPVILSWEDVELDAANPDDGYNVVFHEFAHQLDAESGANDGAPVLPDRSMAAEWAHVMGREYKRLIGNVESGRPHLIDDYAASDPAEFFAVVTELFLEQPVEMASDHPQLYGLMQRFYHQDPLKRFASSH